MVVEAPRSNFDMKTVSKEPGKKTCRVQYYAIVEEVLNAAEDDLYMLHFTCLIGA